MSFAEPLKQMVAILLDRDFQDMNTEEGKNSIAASWLPDKTVREVLQIFGTEVAQHFGPSIWVRRSFKEIEELDLENVIFTDVRFPHEILEISKRGGILIRLFVPQDIEPSDPHYSENALNNKDFKYVISNPRENREDLKEALKMILKLNNII
jgi:hypothetical protein